MSFKKEYLDELIEINLLIQSNKLNELTSLQKIEKYIKSIKNLGIFSSSNWKKEWRKEVYKFGVEFKERNPEKIFEYLNREIKSSVNDSEIEVLEFIKSEVFVNFFTFDESIEYLLEISKKFKMNPEFKNTLSIIYSNNGEHKLSCKYLKQALKIETNNQDWLESIYMKEYKISTDLISQKKHKEADDFIKQIVNSNFYKKYRSDNYQNFFIFLQQRNDDQLLIENKLLDINKSSKLEIEKLFEKSSLKTIEVLGFFTAIIAFIFGTINIIVKTELAAALILITSFGLIMLVFILTLSIVFVKTNKKLIEDNRFWTLIIMLLLNILLIFFNNPISEIIK